MDPDQFIGDISDNFVCAICLWVVKDPVEHVDCEKIFCQPCLTVLTESTKKNECPHCRNLLTNRTKPMNRVVREFYEKLQMRCRFADKGCTEVFPWTTQANHESVCVFHRIECPHCQEVMASSQLKSHEQEKCPMIQVVCSVPGCQQSMLRKHIDNHDQENFKSHKLLFEKRIKALEEEARTDKETIRVLTTMGLTNTTTRYVSDKNQTMTTEDDAAIMELLSASFDENNGTSSTFVPGYEPSAPPERNTIPVPPRKKLITLTGHSNNVTCLTIHGDRLFSGSTDLTIRVWNLTITSQQSTYPCISTMLGHTNSINCLVVNNGKLYSGSIDKNIRIWELQNYTCIAILSGHSDCVTSLVMLSSDYLCSGSIDKTIKLWNTSTNTCMNTISKHKDFVYCIITNKIGNRLYSGSRDTKIIVWDIDNSNVSKLIIKKLISLKGHSDSVRCLVLSHDETHLYSGSSDKTIKLWE